VATLRYLWSKDNPGITVPEIADESGYSLAGIRTALLNLEQQGLARRDHGQTQTVDGSFHRDSRRHPAVGMRRAVKRTPDTWWLTDAGMLAADLAEVAE
jgi:DeoR/GlpR family transcriptional regulator of sugar metabolism